MHFALGSPRARVHCFGYRPAATPAEAAPDSTSAVLRPSQAQITAVHLSAPVNAATMAGDMTHELAHGAGDPVRRERFGERRLPNGKEAVGRAREARARQIGFTRSPIGIETEREHDHAGFAAAVRVPLQPRKPVRKGAAHNGSPGDTNRIRMTFGAPTSSGCSA